MPPKVRKRNRKQQPMMNHALQPPPYISNSIVSRTFRFQHMYQNNGTTSVFNITPAKLGALQVICTAAMSLGTQLYEAVKVRKIEMWASPTVDGTVIDIGVLYSGNIGGTFGAQMQRSSQTIGMTRPAYVSTVPSKMSQAAQWQPTNTGIATNNIFTLTIGGTGPTAGTSLVAVTVDVHLTLRMTQDLRVTGNTVALGTAALLTALYHLPLDNPAGGTGSGGNSWTPDRTLISV